MMKVLTASILTFALLLVSAPVCSEEMAIDEQKLALIGEWRCDWPGISGDSSTLIIHEIDAAKGKARCTYIRYPGDSDKSEHKVLADFFPGANPKLTFKTRGNDLTCVLYKDILAISFVGSVRGVPMSNTTTMYKYPKK
jgi:hypothetical protein